jgi:hypothetical protein
MALASGCSAAGPEVPTGDADVIADAGPRGEVDAAGDGGPRADASAPADGPDHDAERSEGSPASPGDAGTESSTSDAGVTCSIDGLGGQCIDVAACAMMTSYMSTPGYCPGPANIECCTVIPNVADNPPVPTGWKLMAQADVTADMTAWAVAILDDPTTYPMFATAMRVFGTLTVMAIVEWHPPDFQNSAVHRGVTLYQPM